MRSDREKTTLKGSPAPTPEPAASSSPREPTPPFADAPLEWPKTVRAWSVFPALLVVRSYQLCLRPFLPPVCRFQPSCSRYSVEAFKERGLAVGLALTLWRILRCNPLCRGGYDPVPARRGRDRAV